jgi:alkylation response protein AidB-like acyl-CoA dehydrogenase
MDFSFTDDQSAIQALAHQVFGDQATDEALLRLARSGETWDETLWQTLAEAGLLGVTVPEELGGSGLGLTELCLILQEQGRRVAPVPLWSSLVLGAAPIRAFGTEAQQADYLRPLVSGELKLTAAIAELGMPEAVATLVSATHDGDAWVLNGEKHCVPDGASAHVVLVPAVDAEGRTSIFLVDTSQPGVEVQAQEIGMLGTRSANLVLRDLKLGADRLLGAAGQGAEIVDWIEQRANLGHCAMATGVAEEAMQRTAAYTGERKQFGVPIGSFQALAMRMADAYIDVEAMRSTWWLAMWRLEQGLPAAAEVRAAKWWACEGAHRVVHTAQHLHAGIGADIDYPIHRYFLWAKQLNYALGGSGRQLEELGRLLAADDSIGYAALEV